jgi:hypothetical protein
MTSTATQNNPDVPGGVARVRVTASFRYSDTLIARGIDVRNWHQAAMRLVDGDVLQLRVKLTCGARTAHSCS